MMRDRYRNRLVRLAIALLAYYAGQPVYAQQSVPAWRVTARVRIGSVNDPAQVLTHVNHVLVGPDGHVYIAQPREQHVKVFDLTGRLVRTIGRLGRGPGEFQTVTAIGLKADTLYVTDELTHLVSYFTLAGTLLTSFRMASPIVGSRPADMFLPGVPMIILSDGSGLAQASATPAMIGTGNAHIPYYRLARDGRVLATLGTRYISPVSVEIVSDGQRHYGRRPFPDEPIFEVAADGTGLIGVERAVTSGRDATFRVFKINPDGDTVFDRRYSYTPQRVSESIVDRAAQVIQATLSRRPSPPTFGEVRRALRAGDHVPDRLVAVTRIASGADGSIWLRREEPEPGATAEWLVLDTHGNPAGTLRLPATNEVMAVIDGYLAALERDDLDVPFIQVYILHRR